MRERQKKFLDWFFPKKESFKRFLSLERELERLGELPSDEHYLDWIDLIFENNEQPINLLELLEEYAINVVISWELESVFGDSFEDFTFEKSLNGYEAILELSLISAYLEREYILKELSKFMKEYKKLMKMVKLERITVYSPEAKYNFDFFQISQILSLSEEEFSQYIKSKEELEELYKPSPDFIRDMELHSDISYDDIYGEE